MCFYNFVPMSGLALDFAGLEGLAWTGILELDEFADSNFHVWDCSEKLQQNFSTDTIITMYDMILTPQNRWYTVVLYGSWSFHSYSFTLFNKPVMKTKIWKWWLLSFVQLKIGHVLYSCTVQACVQRGTVLRNSQGGVAINSRVLLHCILRYSSVARAAFTCFHVDCELAVANLLVLLKTGKSQSYQEINQLTNNR